MVKAQVAGGGRGKAGAVQSAASLDEAARIIAGFGTTVGGKPIHGFRIEQCIDFVHESYLSLSIDAEAASIRVMVAAEGGVDVEAGANTEGGARSVLANPEQLANATKGLVRRAAPVAEKRIPRCRAAPGRNLLSL